MNGVAPVIAAAWAIAAALLTWTGGGGAAEPAAQAPRARGAKVTFERVRTGDEPREAHVQRARLLSLAVERGETPTPFVQPGLFRAAWQAVVVLPVRDRYRFRIDGRGAAKLSVNGTQVLDGSLRPGKPLESEPVRLQKGDNQIALQFESSAMGDGQVRLLWSGPDFAFEPIAPDRLEWPSDDAEIAAGELLDRGLHVFAERRCARCHEPEEVRIGESAFGELDTAGPDLRFAGGRLHVDWIAAWLREPRAFRADATMPRARFQHARDADDVAAWLASLGSPQAGVEFAAGAAERGAARFLELGCVACHVAPERDRADAALGDRLSLWYVCAKWQPGALVDFLQDPRRSYEHVRMPDFALSRDDAMALAAYLLSAQVEALPAVKGDAERGRKLAQEHRCDACHALDLPISGRREARLRNLKPDRGCLASDAAAPDHGLSQDDIAAVRAFLPFTTSVPFRRAPLDFARRHLRAARCTACHGFDGEPSTWARVAEQAQAKAPLPVEQDPVAQGVPALTWVGEKLQPSWISRFVTGAEPSPRPWLHARMPAFHRFGPAVAQGLVRAHGYGQQDEPARAGDAQSAIFGERLVQIGQGFGCVQCHAIGDKPAVQVFERAGINLAVARRRLRHEYYSRWLLDPPRIDPDARMSRYADAKGKTPFTDVLGGDAAKQFEAIWQHLGTLR